MRNDSLLKQHNERKRLSITSSEDLLAIFHGVAGVVQLTTDDVVLPTVLDLNGKHCGCDDQQSSAHSNDCQNDNHPVQTSFPATATLDTRKQKRKGSKMVCLSTHHIINMF